jgi:hypothetical protein
MRKDLNKVIVERPRFHDGWKTLKGEHKAWQKAIKNDDHPSRGKMSIGWGSKELNENLNPLFRFLESKIGKNWNKVYSEIRENINPKNAVQLHILQHLEQYVEVNTIQSSNGVITDSRGTSIGDPFFVHPKTGQLLKNKDSYHFRRYKYKSSLPPYPSVMIDGERYIESNGVWYNVRMDKFREIKASPHNYRYYETAYDVIQKCHISRDQAYSFYGVGLYAKEKSQLNSKEIRQLGLRKDAA